MVDAINNNRDAVYTGIGAGVGALAGAGYGAWLSKPLLKGDAPSDAFVRRFYDNDVKNAAETAKKEVQDLYKEIKETKNLKTEDIAKKLGLAVVEGQENTTDIAQKYKWDDVFADTDNIETAKGKIDKVVAENATKGQKSGKELTKLKNAFAKLGDNADQNAVTEFVSKHADILGEDAKTSIKDYTSLKTKVEEVITPLTNAKSKILDNFDVSKNSMIELGNDADNAAKSAFEAVKKAAKETKLWAGAKWAAIGLAVLGACSYIGSKLTAPKAPAENNQENA